MKVWRICRLPYADEAFSGEGARRFGGRPFGGRWSLRGVPMVYASTSLSLAAIELFVHLEPGQAPRDLVYLSATLPDGEPGRIIQAAELPPDWWSDDIPVSGDTTRELGDAWIRSRSSLAIKVPSVPMATIISADSIAPATMPLKWWMV